MLSLPVGDLFLRRGCHSLCSLHNWEVSGGIWGRRVPALQCGYDPAQERSHNLSSVPTRDIPFGGGWDRMRLVRGRDLPAWRFGYSLH